ncbi:MAG: molecular chaperone DnaJ [Thermomicrobiales bacterium]
MSVKRDYYETLGVDRSADSTEIRRAYRRLARQYHPDVNKDDDAEEKFKEVTEAYEVLRDDERRAAYDRFGHAAFQGGGQAPGDPFGFGGQSPFGDIFESFFGGFTRQSRQRSVPRGTDVRATLDLTFEEAVFGVEKEIEFTRFEPCESCHGTRMKDGAEPIPCVQCSGTGEVRRVQQTILGQVVTATPCDRCGGEGKIITDPCPDCNGRGRQPKKARVEVTVPAGVDDQSVLRLTGQGEQIRDGVPGNLLVSLKVAPHKSLQRSGRNILYDLPINVAQATLGAEIEIPTVEGTVELTIPAGTQPMQQFRLRGRGVPDMGGRGRGDQMVTVHVVIPTELDKDQRRLFEELAEDLGEAVMPKDRGFFSKVKDALGV